MLKYKIPQIVTLTPKIPQIVTLTRSVYVWDYNNLRS